jgi:hypothetical protein
MTDNYSPNMVAGGVNTVGTFTPDELVIRPGRTLIRTYASGHGVIPRGGVLGKITASGKLILSVAAATDGSQTPYAIAAEPVDTSAGDASGATYLGGTYNSNAFTYGAGHTAATVFDPLRVVGIDIVAGQPY